MSYLRCIGGLREVTVTIKVFQKFVFDSGYGSRGDDICRSTRQLSVSGDEEDYYVR